MCLKRDILFIVCCLSLTSCQDWCEVIAPNNTYKGLGIYNLYGQYWFYNKQGLKCKFNFDINKRGQSNIPMDYSSVEKENQDIVQRFDISYEKPKNNYYIVNCWTYEQNVENRVNCSYVSVHQSITRSYDTTDEHKLDRNFVYLKPFPSQIHDNWLLAVNKIDRNDRWKVIFEPSKLDYQRCGDECPSIPVVEHMDGSLFGRIDSIVEFERDDITGHILLFDINHRPYYCSQLENQSLSEQVLHID